MSEKPTLSQDIRFAAIPEWVLLHDSLSPQAVRLYGILSRFSEGNRWPGRQLLAERLKVGSVKTVDRALKELVDVCAITIVPRWDEAGDRKSNAYELHFAPPEGVAPRMSPPPDTNVHAGRDTDVATGGPTDVAVERASLSTTPLPPASGGTATSPTCNRPGARPHTNCRGCGTTNRQVEAARRRAAAEQKRADDAAALKAEREARAAPAAGPSLVKQQVAAATRKTIAQNRRTR